jgi:hypothetical protein
MNQLLGQNGNVKKQLWKKISNKSADKNIKNIAKQEIKIFTNDKFEEIKSILNAKK